MNMWFLVAGVVSLVNAAAHTFLGGREVADPLKAVSEMDEMPKWVLYYCWHDVTLVLWAMAGGLLWGAFVPSGLDVAVFVGLLALGFAFWGLLLVPRVGQSYRVMPQGWLFVPVVVLVAVGASG